MTDIYDEVHRRLRKERGSAVDAACSHPDCDRRSTGYALIRIPETTTITWNSHGKIVRLSRNLDDYGPACTRHNAQMDHGGNWTYCPHGHARIVWGADRSGYCRGCARHKPKTSHQPVRKPAHKGTNNTERSRA